jgi:curved DNA-binding protein CbpA
VSGVTHYDVLGVEPTATSAEIRQAYVARARLLHPDRLQDLPPGEAARRSRDMQDVNEAFRVLRSPESRSVYDAGLAGRAAPGRTPGTSGTPPPGPGDDDATDRGLVAERHATQVDPAVSVLRSLPWVVVLFVLGVIFVVTAFAGGSDDGDGRSSYDLVGACVRSQQGVGVVEVPCTEPNVGRVEGTWLCLRPAG